MKNLKKASEESDSQCFGYYCNDLDDAVRLHKIKVVLKKLITSAVIVCVLGGIMYYYTVNYNPPEQNIETQEFK